ncbi:hypothetical protein DFH09DRAFT_1131566 [Mycena vulgaris]|nr:hypothetical protein DFH09DRAFT_1131566 [Mycena vulgaris]
MPFFPSSSGVQINGGNFYDIAGNMNLQSAQPAIESESQRAIEFPSAQAEVTGRLLSGPERRNQHMGAARVLPYGASFHSSEPHMDQHESTSPSTPLSRNLPYPHSPNLGHSELNHRPPREAINKVIENPPTDYGSRPSPTGNHPVPTDLRGHRPLDSTVSVVNSQVFPWNTPPHEARTSINGGTFISGNVNHINGETGLQFLYRAAANDASHDSGERYPQPRCHPATRTQILQDLYAWSSEDDPRSRILWLHGPAGAGKSAIAQSFCQKLGAEGRLGGSFFFRRGHPSRGNGNKLFSTIAYQLAVLLPELSRTLSQRENSNLSSAEETLWAQLQELNHVIARRVESDPAIVNKALSTQLQRLIVEPCRNNISGRIFVIIIDGLDECEGLDLQQEILRSIGNAFHGPHLPLRFFIASRPEPHIVEVFQEPCVNGLRRPLNIQQSSKDVRRFLQDEFSRIHREHRETMGTVCKPWPSPADIETLVRKSSGYFIYASTVIRFIDDKNFRPTERLEIILGITEPDFESPYSALDQLYTQILTAAPARPQLLRILSVIVAKLNLSTPHIEQLLGLKHGDVRLALRGLHSLINIPQRLSDDVTVHHASFLDFLNDLTRSSSFHVGDFHRHSLACDVLKAFSYMHDDPAANRIGHVAWKLVPVAFTYLISTQPSPDLIPLLHSFNPDYLFYKLEGKNVWGEKILGWLKNMRPLPEGLIGLWEDYRFMILCDITWLKTARIQISRGPGWKLSPQVGMIIHAYKLHNENRILTSLSNIRLLFNYPWEELRTAICSLRGIIDEKLAVPTLSALAEPPNSVVPDLVHGCIRLLNKIATHKLPWEFRSATHAWSRLLRSCPPCPEILQDLWEIEPALESSKLFEYYDPDQFRHNIIQWLKTFPQPPLDLIDCFERDLEERCRRYGESESRP